MKPCVPLPATLAALLATAAFLPGQVFQPPPGKQPDEATLRAIADKTAQLDKAIRVTRKQDVGDPFLSDLEVYHRAATQIVRHNEFFLADSAKKTLEVLDRGLARATAAAKGDFSWLKTTGKTVVRGYRSRIDGSVQPFAVTFPERYGESKKWRVDVVLHGRDKTLTEVKFLHQHGDRAAPADLNHVRLDIYGRGNNAYRWAGETDVIEVIETFLATERALRRDRFLDPSRWVLRGFSMGGAGAWHLGLHRPDSWCVLGPGAGFTTTHGYVGKLPARLPPWQESCLRIYDAVEYAENLFNVPAVAYAGSEDAQLKAARNIEARLAGTPFAERLKILVAPGLAHKFPPEWQKKTEEAYAPHVARGREDSPKRVRFVTYTLKYPSCDWVHLMGLGRHYEKSVVDAERTEDGFKVTTTNVTALRLRPPKGVLHDLTIAIDGQQVTARPWGLRGGPAAVYLWRKGNRWASVLPQRMFTEHSRFPVKSAGLQGPIDDAFTEAFLCVRGTGKPWHAATEKYAEANLRRFRAEWAKYFRGDLPVKDDSDVTEEDIADRHLILFGDPSSNSLIGQVLDGLPLSWTAKSVAFAGKDYPADRHVPVLIYPSPLNARRYVVLNSGHTFRAADLQGTNALLYPRLGDYAILRLAEGKDAAAAEVTLAGLFDEHWQIPGRGR